MTIKKRIIIAVLIILSVICALKVLDLSSYSFVKARAVNYLCDKYDANKDEFDLVDYKPSKIYIGSSGEIEQHLAFSDFSFEFKYKDKTFFVNRYKGKFYDDYQIDDIEKWCTEWLKENVDKNIIGIFLDSKSIAYFENNTNKSNCYVIKESDAEEFILNCKEKKNEKIFLTYLNVDRVEYDKYKGYEKQIKRTWNRFSDNENIKLFFTYDNKLEKVFHNRQSFTKANNDPNEHMWFTEFR